MVTLFEDSEQGGYFMTASDGEQLIARPKETYDGAIPSGNSAAAMVLQRLVSLTGEIQWQDAAHRQMRFLAGKIGQYPASSCFGMLAMMDKNRRQPKATFLFAGPPGVGQTFRAETAAKALDLPKNVVYDAALKLDE